MGLRAQVRTRDGWAVRHAVVTVTDMSGAQVLRAAADGDGAVTTGTDLAPGPYTVIVRAMGYAPAAATALVTASGRAEVGTVVLARQGGSELPPPGTWSLDPAHSSVGSRNTSGSPACTAASRTSAAASTSRRTFHGPASTR